MQIYIHRDGQQLGPYSIDAVREYVAQGALKPDDLAWHEGAAEWQPLHRVIASTAGEVAPAPVPATTAVVEPPWVPPRRDGTTSIPFVRENRIPQSLTAWPVAAEPPKTSSPSPTESVSVHADSPEVASPEESEKVQARPAKQHPVGAGRFPAWAVVCLLLGVLFLLGGGVALTLLAHHAVAGLRPGEIRVAGLGAVGLGGIFFVTGLALFFKR